MIAARRFVVRCHGDDRIVVENVRTGEQARVDDPAAIGEQIRRWLHEATDGPPGGEPARTATMGADPDDRVTAAAPTDHGATDPDDRLSFGGLLDSAVA